MKKRISLLLALVTVIAAMVLVVSFSASATTDFDPTAPQTEGAYAEIYDANNNFVAALTDVSSGVKTFFAKTKNTDGYSIHIWKEFTTADEILIYGNTLLDGNGFLVTSTASDTAVRVYNSEADSGHYNKGQGTGARDTVRIKNFVLNASGHGVAYYNSAVLQLEDGNKINCTTSSKNAITPLHL